MESHEEVVSSSNPENHEKTLQPQSRSSGNHNSTDNIDYRHGDEKQRDKGFVPPRDDETSSNIDDPCSFYNLPSEESFCQALMDQVVAPQHQERPPQPTCDDDHHREERPRRHRRASSVSDGTSASTTVITSSSIDENEMMMELLLSEYRTQPRLPLGETIRAIHAYCKARKSN